MANPAKRSRLKGLGLPLRRKISKAFGEVAVLHLQFAHAALSPESTGRGLNDKIDLPAGLDNHHN
jgi:hypothetical protein